VIDVRASGALSEAQADRRVATALDDENAYWQSGQERERTIRRRAQEAHVRILMQQHEDPSQCDYARGVGNCTQPWRGCGNYHEPRCVTQSDIAMQEDGHGL
jgi:hypothetical protein